MAADIAVDANGWFEPPHLMGHRIADRLAQVVSNLRIASMVPIDAPARVPKICRRPIAAHGTTRLSRLIPSTVTDLPAILTVAPN